MSTRRPTVGGRSAGRRGVLDDLSGQDLLGVQDFDPEEPADGVEVDEDLSSATGRFDRVDLLACLTRSDPGNEVDVGGIRLWVLGDLHGLILS